MKAWGTWKNEKGSSGNGPVTGRRGQWRGPWRRDMVPKALGIWDAGQFRNVPPFMLTARRSVTSVDLTFGLSGPQLLHSGPIRRHPEQGHGAEA